MLGDTLVAKGVITADQLQKALDAQKTNNSKIGDELVALGFTTHEKIEAALK
jgi:predicted transcriptional regulator